MAKNSCAYKEWSCGINWFWIQGMEYLILFIKVDWIPSKIA